MRNKFLAVILFAVAVIITASFRQNAVEPNGYFHSAPFKFTLQQGASTSSGVYTTDGVLVRTLWSGVKYATGTHSAVWDGTNDEGNLMPAASYQIKVLSNNVKYAWEGVLGNTSGKFSGPTIFRGHNPIQGLAITGKTAYYTVGYNEQGSSCYKFNTDDPQGKVTIGSGGIESDAVATDGKLVYWVSFEIKTNSNFIQATNVINDAPVNFASGQAFTVFKSKARLSVVQRALSPDRIKALAVQKNGQYLLSAHTNLNQVQVMNKTTGKLVSTANITNPTALAVDQSNHAWIACVSNGKPAVLRYQINADGGLQYLNKMLPGLVRPLAIAVSPDDATVLVADGGVSQQLKAYSNTSGELKWEFGDAGGYSNSAAVTDHKFYFSNVRSELGTCLAFEADGSFWVQDSGNSRLQHYSVNRGFINRVMYLPTSYSVTVDRNDATRVFSDYLEFKIDYSKPLSPNNGSWTLVNNWGATVPNEFDRKYNRLKDVVTLKNDRTYTFIGSKNKVLQQVLEFTAQHKVRFTGKTIPVNYSMDKEGDLYYVSSFKQGVPNTWTKLKLTGFDQNNNPVWGNPGTVATTQPAINNDPLNESNGVLFGSEKTSTNIFIAFNQRASINGSARPHLGGVRLGDNKWLWQTAAGTHRNYKGDFPADGAFDNGNNVRYAGGMALALDKSIFWGYYGEFWKSSETNKWNQVYDNGLLVGQFGITGPQTTEKEGAAMMAGNSMAASVVKDAYGNMYLYHNDEATHGGVHRWKISNVSSINEQVINITLSHTKQGLLTEYFTGNDLDNLNRVYIGISSSAAFSANQLPAQVINLNKGKLASVRLSGFIHPLNTTSYTFVNKASANMRLWVGGELVLDSWTGTTTLSKPLSLEANVSYPIKMEYRQPAGAPAFTLLWSANGQAATAVSSDRLVPAEIPQQNTPFDLLEGLPFDGIVEDGMYGWQRGKSAEDYTNRYGQFWTVRTSKRIYNRRSSPDLFASFRQANTIKSITRNMVNSNEPLKQWKINAIVNFEGNYANGDKDLSANGSGGSFLEVLDNAGKVITRLFFNEDYSADVGRLYANNKVVIKTTRKGIGNIMYASQPLSIQVENGICTVQYGAFPIVTAPIFDPASHWDQPKTFRVYFWCKTQNSNRAIDIEKMSYSFKK